MLPLPFSNAIVAVSLPFTTRANYNILFKTMEALVTGKPHFLCIPTAFILEVNPCWK